MGLATAVEYLPFSNFWNSLAGISLKICRIFILRGGQEDVYNGRDYVEDEKSTFIEPFIDAFNFHRQEHEKESNFLSVIESIPEWYGFRGTWIDLGCLYYVSLNRKPEKGMEIQNIASGTWHVMLGLKVVKNENVMTSSDKSNHATSILRRLCQPWTSTIYHGGHTPRQSKKPSRSGLWVLDGEGSWRLEQRISYFYFEQCSCTTRVIGEIYTLHSCRMERKSIWLLFDLQTEIERISSQIRDLCFMKLCKRDCVGLNLQMVPLPLNWALRFFLSILKQWMPSIGRIEFAKTAWTRRR